MLHNERFANMLRRMTVGLLACCLFIPGLSRADDKVSLDFVNTDIAAVAKAVGYITHRNFILDPRVKGTINIVSTRPIPRNETYDVFLSALRTQGYTVVEGRGAYKIVPAANAKMNYTLTFGKKLRHSNDSVVTQVYPLQFTDATRMLPVLRPLISPNNVISAMTVGNMLVITDYADNLKRIDRLIEAMDQPVGQDSEVIRLKYAVAGDVAKLLQDMLGSGKNEPESQKVQIAADSRTNTLLVHSENPSKLLRVRQLVAKLDDPSNQNAGPRVIYLHNADATKLVQTLSGSTTSGSSLSKETETLSSSSKDQTSASAGLSSSAPMSSASTPAAASASLANGQIKILADVPANAIILIGPAVLQAQYAEVIKKLDTRPAEVFIQALIVEMTANKAQELGIQWQFLSGLGKSSTSVIGGTNFGTNNNILATSENIASVGQGINLGLMDGTVTVPITGADGTTTDVQILNLGMLAHALESQSGTHILSAPNLLTLNNEEAQIVVGQNVPFVTGSYTLSNTSGTTSPFQTIERQDVGLMLKVRPRITADGSIQLKLYQEVSSIQSESSTQGPTTNKRSIDTSVVVDDKHIVVLGGLMQDTFENNVDKVPLLGDIPVLGNLFKSKTRSQVKTDLFVFLRPVVVRSRQGLDAVTQPNYDYALGRYGKAKDRHGMKLETAPKGQPWVRPNEPSETGKTAQ